MCGVECLTFWWSGSESWMPPSSKGVGCNARVGGIAVCCCIDCVLHERLTAGQSCDVGPRYPLAAKVHVLLTYLT